MPPPLLAHRAAGLRRSRPRLAVVIAASIAALALGACAGGSEAGAPPGTTASTVARTAPATSPASTAPASTAPASTAPAFTATSTTTPTATGTGTCSGADASAVGPVDPDAAGAARDLLAPALDQLQAAGGAVGVSVWVDGVGEVAAADPTAPLVPASNQKLFVAAAALELLPLDTVFTTTVVATGPVVGGVVQGDLVLVGGGDSTLTAVGPHSLDTLAAQVQAAGISAVAGRLLVDEDRYDAVRTGQGWVDGAWQQSNVGLLSAVVVDRNRAYADPAFVADPALVNVGRFRGALDRLGVTVHQPDGVGSGQLGLQVAALDSAPLPEVVTAMLSRSDNLAAELLLKEIGRRTSGLGTAAAGAEAGRAALAAQCIVLDGTDADGSGLSRSDARSPDAWRRLLDGARTRPWYPTFRDSLAVSGQSGTLQARLTSPAVVGKVRAKTGSTAVSGALSGYLTTASGRRVVFSIVVNQPRGAPEPAIDEFVLTLVRDL